MTILTICHNKFVMVNDGECTHSKKQRNLEARTAIESSAGGWKDLTVTWV
jgi:hypothetical protein